MIPENVIIVLKVRKNEKGRLFDHLYRLLSVDCESVDATVLNFVKVRISNRLQSHQKRYYASAVDITTASCEYLGAVKVRVGARCVPCSLQGTEPVSY